MEDLSYKKKLTVMMAIMMAMFFSAVNQTIVSTAMPRIIAILNGMDYYTWVITIYMLTSTISAILVGKLSDIYGRKPFILMGIIFFMLGSFLSGFSMDIFQLILYRGIQGFGGGVIMSTAFTAVGDLFAPRERGKWTGVMGGVFGISSILGPPLGGWIVDNMDWKWLFWIFLPLGLVAFVMIFLLFPSVERREGEEIDYLGSIFLSATIIALLLAFSWAGTLYPWLSVEIIGLFGLAFLCLFIFLYVESKAKSPVLPIDLFRNDIVTISNCIGFLMHAGMMGALIYLPFFIQGVKGVSPTYSGYVTMPMSVAMVFLSTITGRWITKTGKYKHYGLIGLFCMILGMLLMAFMDSIWLAVLSVIVFGFGLGMGMPVFTLAAQNAVSNAQLGVVTASAQLFRNLGGTIGIALMGTILNSSLVKQLNRTPPTSHMDLDQLDPALLEQVAQLQQPEMLLDHPRLEQLQGTLPLELQPIITVMIESVQEALSKSLSMVFFTGTLLLIIALILTYFLREIPLRTSNKF